MCVCVCSFKTSTDQFTHLCENLKSRKHFILKRTFLCKFSFSVMVRHECDVNCLEICTHFCRLSWGFWQDTDNSKDIVQSKVKVSRDRPRWPKGFRVEIPGAHFQRLSRPQGTWFCQGYHGKKSPVTLPGIDPGTVRLVAQCLNHYATPGPKIIIQRYKYLFI